VHILGCTGKDVITFDGTDSGIQFETAQLRIRQLFHKIIVLR
jgi:hypothetical protein